MTKFRVGQKLYFLDYGLKGFCQKRNKTIWYTRKIKKVNPRTIVLRTRGYDFSNLKIPKDQINDSQNSIWFTSKRKAIAAVLKGTRRQLQDECRDFEETLAPLLVAVRELERKLERLKK